ncbi:MAG: (2Fe-2S) ferredoxin [Saprospiraceae bacterium]|jgi:(2Fe-2S) ferredoxin
MKLVNIELPVQPLHYTKHIFVCINQREHKSACADFDSQNARDYLKQQMKAAGIYGEGLMRVSDSGCLGRCELGPILVIYPDAVWYTYVDHADIDEILQTHLKMGEIVERLLLE